MNELITACPETTLLLSGLPVSLPAPMAALVGLGSSSPAARTHLGPSVHHLCRGLTQGR